MAYDPCRAPTHAQDTHRIAVAIHEGRAVVQIIDCRAGNYRWFAFQDAAALERHIDALILTRDSLQGGFRPVLPPAHATEHCPSLLQRLSRRLFR